MVINIFLIAVSGADVYVGVNRNSPASSALIFKNGIATDLSSGFSTSFIGVVAINGTDVYVAGRQLFTTSTFWKNGVVTNLPSSASGTETAAYSISISNNNIYVSGFEKTPVA